MQYELYDHNRGQSKVAASKLEPLLSFLRASEDNFVEGRGPALRKRILEGCQRFGWTNPLKLDAESRITVTGMNAGVALCLQFGNMSRFYADLLKLQFLHEKGRATAAVYILPSKEGAQKVGSNIAHFDRFVQELKMYEKIVSIPIVVIGLEAKG